MSRKITIPILALISILSASCETVKYQSVDLTGQLPPPIQGSQLVTNEELMCLSDETVRKIKLYEDRIVTLTNIIKSTKKD